jgi:hypothetical protein
MSTDELSGGWINRVVRIGETVRRSPSGAYTNGNFATELLGFFEQAGWSGAPRFLGTDEEGRQILTYIDGHVAWDVEQPPAVTSDDSLVRVAELVREFHDLTAGTPLAGDEEVVCHNDLMPGNTVYQDLGSGLRPVAFIDWDNAAPGKRIIDFCHMCWQYAGLGPQTLVEEAAHRTRLMCDAYGLDDRSEVITGVLWWQDRAWRWIRTGAAVGDASMIELRDSGAAGTVLDALRWVTRNRRELERALR